MRFLLPSVLFDDDYVSTAMCDGGVYDDDDFTANDMCCGCDDSTEWWDMLDDDVVVDDDYFEFMIRNGYCSAEEYDIDYNPGNDLASVAASSSSECCDECAKVNGCVAYTWSDYQGGTCWLRDSVAGRTYSPGCVSATYTPSATDLDGCMDHEELIPSSWNNPTCAQQVAGGRCSQNWNTCSGSYSDYDNCLCPASCGNCPATPVGSGANDDDYNNGDYNNDDYNNDALDALDSATLGVAWTAVGIALTIASCCCVLIFLVIQCVV